MNYKEFLASEGIDIYSALPLSSVRVFRPDKLERLLPHSKGGSLLVLLMPYLVRGEKRNISAYAVSEDYHLYFKGLSERLGACLSAEFEGFRFCGAADSSPADEVNAAVTAGLGVFGDNGLFMCEKYGSYVFIGGTYSDMPAEGYGLPPKASQGSCKKCGRCISACPKNACGFGADKSLCLSALTQKKGELTAEEAETLIKYGSAWGCDICQEVCPMNENAEETKIRFFRENRTPYLSSGLIDGMSDEDFARRAYSWRRRETILRNLKLLGE